MQPDQQPQLQVLQPAEIISHNALQQQQSAQHALQASQHAMQVTHDALQSTEHAQIQATHDALQQQQLQQQATHEALQQTTHEALQPTQDALQQALAVSHAQQQQEHEQQLQVLLCNQKYFIHNVSICSPNKDKWGSHLADTAMYFLFRKPYISATSLNWGSTRRYPLDGSLIYTS